MNLSMLKCRKCAGSVRFRTASFFFFFISFTISSFYEFRLDDSALFVVFELKLFLRRCAAFFFYFVCTCLLLAGFFFFFFLFYLIFFFFFVRSRACLCLRGGSAEDCKSLQKKKKRTKRLT